MRPGTIMFLLQCSNWALTPTLRGWDDIDTRDAGLAAREGDPQRAGFKKAPAGCLMAEEVKFVKPAAFSVVTSPAWRARPAAPAISSPSLKAAAARLKRSTAPM